MMPRNDVGAWPPLPAIGGLPGLPSAVAVKQVPAGSGAYPLPAIGGQIGNADGPRTRRPRRLFAIATTQAAGDGAYPLPTVGVVANAGRVGGDGSPQPGAASPLPAIGGQPPAAYREPQLATSDAYPLPVIGVPQTAIGARVDRDRSMQCVKQIASDDAFPLPAIGGVPGSGTRTVRSEGDRDRQQKRRARQLSGIGNGAQQARRCARRGQAQLTSASASALPALPAIESGSSVGANIQHPATLSGDAGVPLPAIGGAASAAAGPRGRKVWDCPCTTHDLHRVATEYGGDLASVGVDALPADWLNVECAKRTLMAIGIAADEIDVLEVYAGSGNWTNACQAAGLRAGPCVDSVGRAMPWDMLQARWRRALWAIMVVCLPSWVHSGFPCTFWSHFTHMTQKASTSELEGDRTLALVHVIVTLQLAAWQNMHKRHVSFENPPRCASWRLDIVEHTLAAIGAKKYFFDSCAWGHADPVSKKPIKKQQCVASTADLSGLRRRCACHAGRGRCPRGIHEVVQGAIVFPSGKRITRSAWSAAYPVSLCDAWAQIVKECVLAIGS